jgi:hypothetical protein
MAAKVRSANSVNNSVSAQRARLGTRYYASIETVALAVFTREVTGDSLHDF